MKYLLILLFLFSSFFSNANDTVTIEEIKKTNKMYTESFKKKPITFEPIEIYCTYNEHDYFSHATWFYSDMEKFSDVCKRHDCEEKLIIFEGWRSRDNKASKDNKNRKSNIELNVNNDALAYSSPMYESKITDESIYLQGYIYGDRAEEYKISRVSGKIEKVIIKYIGARTNFLDNGVASACDKKEEYTYYTHFGLHYVPRYPVNQCWQKDYTLTLYGTCRKSAKKRF